MTALGAAVYAEIAGKSIDSIGMFRTCCGANFAFRHHTQLLRLFLTLRMILHTVVPGNAGVLWIFPKGLLFRLLSDIFKQIPFLY
jgi:hypothetical protein